MEVSTTNEGLARRREKLSFGEISKRQKEKHATRRRGVSIINKVNISHTQQLRCLPHSDAVLLKPQPEGQR